MCSAQEYQRKLHPDDLPLRAQQQRIQRGDQCHFIVRKNPHYPRRRLSSVGDNKSSALIAAPLTESNLAALDEQTAEVPLNKSCSHSVANANADANANNRRYVSVYLGDRSNGGVCKMCRNNFRSCEFCLKNNRKSTGSRLTRIPTASNLTESRPEDNKVINRVSTYNPVYNIREIRTVCNSFSSLGGDKIELDDSLTQAAPQPKRPSLGSVVINTSPTASINSSVILEEVNNNPAKGFGNFVYI